MFSNYIGRLVGVAVLVVIALAAVIYLAIGRAPKADQIWGYSGICAQSGGSGSSCPTGIPGGYAGSCLDKLDNDGDTRIDTADTDCGATCPIRQEGFPCQYTKNGGGGVTGGGGRTR